MNELIYSGLITIVSLIEQNILKILNIVLILYRLGKGLRALNTLSQATGYPDYRISIFVPIKEDFNNMGRL